MDGQKIIKIAHCISLTIAFAGVIIFTIGYHFGWMVLLTGAMFLIFVRLYSRAKATDKSLMRLLTILIFGAAMLLGAAYLMKEGKSYWLLPLLIDTVVEFYVSFRLGNKW